MSLATTASQLAPAVEADPEVATARVPCPSPTKSGAGMATRRYIYCITDCNEPTTFGPMGIGNGSEVFAIPHEEISAVVSRTPIERFEISRENTLAHQHVMEALMERGYTVLPVRFDTIAEDKPDGSTDAESRILNHVLTKRKDEFNDLLVLFRDCVELGVKGLWTDMNAVFAEIVDGSSEISLLRKKVRAAGPGWGAGRPSGLLSPQARLGELVKRALDAKKNATSTKLIERVAEMIVDSRENKTFGDPMFANLALLVKKPQQEDFAAALSAFEDEQRGMVKLKFIGPVPPSNFIEVVIAWGD